MMRRRPSSGTVAKILPRTREGRHAVVVLLGGLGQRERDSARVVQRGH